MTSGEKVPEKSLERDVSKIKTTITDIESNKIVTRGYSQKDLIANISFSDMVYLLLRGNLPSPKESKMFNYVLVSFCDHGVTSASTQSARLIASSGSPLNVALSGGLLSFGKNHAGAIEKAMGLFQSTLDDGHDNNHNNKNEDHDGGIVFSDLKIDELAKDIVNRYLNDNKKIPGFGHRYHTKDPRGVKLMDLANEEGFTGKHIKLALAIEKILFEKKGIHINVDGANGAILSDMRFSSSLGIGIFMIGRIPGIIAHINEEITGKKAFRKFCNIDDISYCGYEDKQLDDEI